MTDGTLAGNQVRQELWSASKDVYEAILAHPFVGELASGELSRERFAHYLVQDTHYLRRYGRALAILAGRAPDHDASVMFADHAANAVAAEHSLHAESMTALRLRPDRLPDPAPTTVAYTSYVLATAQGGSFGAGVAAVLPCYWFYRQLAEELSGRDCPDALYRDWIATYAGDAFGSSVESVLELVDRIGKGVAPSERLQMREHFVTAARYEWMFWDAAYRLEGWPV